MANTSLSKNLTQAIKIIGQKTESKLIELVQRS